MLYWTNWNIEKPSIERSYLNGSHRKVIVQKDLFMPHGLGLDVSQQMIYWANNLRHGTFQIERSKVDGSDRQLLYEGKGHGMRGQFIFGLTVFISWLLEWRQISLFPFIIKYIRWENMTYTGQTGIRRLSGLCPKMDL